MTYLIHITWRSGGQCTVECRTRVAFDLLWSSLRASSDVAALSGAMP